MHLSVQITLYCCGISLLGLHTLSPFHVQLVPRLRVVPFSLSFSLTPLPYTGHMDWRRWNTSLSTAMDIPWAHSLALYCTLFLFSLLPGFVVPRTLLSLSPLSAHTNIIFSSLFSSAHISLKASTVFSLHWDSRTRFLSGADSLYGLHTLRRYIGLLHTLGLTFSLTLGFTLSYLSPSLSSSSSLWLHFISLSNSTLFHAYICLFVFCFLLF